MSASVKTLPAVPGGRSTRRTSAFAMSLRTKATSCTPGMRMSAMNMPWPSRWRASSLRSTLAPIQLSEGDETAMLDCSSRDDIRAQFALRDAVAQAPDMAVENALWARNWPISGR